MATELDKRVAGRVAERSAKGQRERADGDATAVPHATGRKARRLPGGDRWASLNAFVDVIAPRLTMAERAVWLVMFRHARDGVVQTSERQLSTAAGVDKATAGRALRQLVELHLAWPVMKSRSKESASRYGLHPQPASCLGVVLARDEQRRSDAHERRQRNGGDRRGKRRRSTTNRVNSSPG